MKKILVLLLTLLLAAAFSLTSLGASVSVATELTQVRSYYTEKDQLTLFEETLAMASMGMLPGKTAFLPEKDGTAGGVAKRILAVTAIGEIPEDDPDLAALKEFQDSDGSFGSVESHCLSMLALASRKEVYHSAKAYQWLMQQQGENGSFSDSPKITALAVSALSLSQNQEELEAVTKAVTYLINYKADNSIDLCWQIIGITDGGEDAATAGDRKLLETLFSYQSPADYSFYRTASDDDTDGQATVMALTALDAINEDSSLYQRLAADGKLTFFDPAQAKPLILFGVVLLVVSAGFWIVILTHKKNTKTLEETKTY